MTVLIREFSPGWSKKLQGKTESGSCPHSLPHSQLPDVSHLEAKRERKRLSRAGDHEKFKEPNRKTTSSFPDLEEEI